MPELHLSEEVYTEAKRRATEEGYSSVEVYVADLLKEDFQDVELDIQQWLTPERLKLIEEADAEIDRGDFYTVEEVKEHFKQRSAALAKKN